MRKIKSSIIRIGIETYKNWLLHKHYLKRMPNVMYAFGLYQANELIGVVTYGKPPSFTLCEGICGKENANKIIELNRLIINENSPANSASYLVGGTLKEIAPAIVVAFADTSMGHVGYIYQACNFLYTGVSPAQKYFRVKTYSMTSTELYRRRARRTKTDILNEYGVSSIEEYWSSDKHRYVYFAGCKHLRSALKYPVLPYPKGDTKRYDANGKILSQLLLV